MQCTQRISYAVNFSGLRQLKSRHKKLSQGRRGKIVSRQVQCVDPQEDHVCVCSAQRISYAVNFSGLRQLKSCHTKLSQGRRGKIVSRQVQCVDPQEDHTFSGHYLRNRYTLDIGVLGYIVLF